MFLKTFSKGGVHPEENKISHDSPIQVQPIPKTVSILLGQHIGKPASPVVSRGDEVKVGTLIAQADGFVSANIHSSVSGKVKKIETILDASGYQKPCITIQCDGEDTWEETIDRSPEIIRDIKLSSEEIIQRIAECGIVGMGGATFPTNVKLMPPKDATPECVIINGAECEPYLTADHRTLLERGEEVLIGLQILMKSVGVTKGYVAIENNKRDAIEKLTEIASSMPGIEIVPMKVKYPQGGEKQLIDTVLKRRVASGKLPVTEGAIVQNVGTALAVYEAVQKHKPLVERVVTVTGKAVKNPCNLLVRIGTPLSELIETAGGMPRSTAKLVSGGPMMGKAVYSDEIPVAKGTSGVLMLLEEDTKRRPMRNCIRCAKCVGACPMGLNPAFLMRDTVYKDWEALEENHVYDCIECGSCSFICPANRPLLDHIRMGKGRVMAIRRARK
ncbi:MAG: electron transport complex subunit RsxC [Porphyromonas sp.]|uniref:electron transport complex subunit RsxC n=1 Tax=Porphyromonas sp. TaxID=1924944 RepID=UPI002A9201C5|nr:electron transport complex subunit RsxC [Porphyromonas sp.]MDD7468160.1 electron transport complex subunit RsxC [Bacteroidales bacterium]MDY6102635.1 electron transport complex subunit RsxC [Porphyromonas sp.]